MVIQLSPAETQGEASYFYANNQLGQVNRPKTVDSWRMVTRLKQPNMKGEAT